MTSVISQMNNTEGAPQRFPRKRYSSLLLYLEHCLGANGVYVKIAEGDLPCLLSCSNSPHTLYFEAL